MFLNIFSVVVKIYLKTNVLHIFTTTNAGD